MTRINVGIPPKVLSRQHLLAEHREIKRLPNHLKKHGLPKKRPPHFKLGTGHVTFLLFEQAYTYHRYCQIYNECKRRKYDVTAYHKAWSASARRPLRKSDYKPTAADAKLLINRLRERDPIFYSRLNCVSLYSTKFKITNK